MEPGTWYKKLSTLLIDNCHYKCYLEIRVTLYKEHSQITLEFFFVIFHAEIQAQEFSAKRSCYLLSIHIFALSLQEEREVFPKDENGKFIFSEVDFLDAWKVTTNKLYFCEIPCEISHMTIQIII